MCLLCLTSWQFHVVKIASHLRGIQHSNVNWESRARTHTNLVLQFLEQVLPPSDDGVHVVSEPGTKHGKIFNVSIFTTGRTRRRCRYSLYTRGWEKPMQFDAKESGQRKCMKQAQHHTTGISWRGCEMLRLEECTNKNTSMQRPCRPILLSKLRNEILRSDDREFQKQTKVAKAELDNNEVCELLVTIMELENW